MLQCKLFEGVLRPLTSSFRTCSSVSLNCLFGSSLEALVKRAFFDELEVPGLDVPGLDVPGLDVPGLDVPDRDPVILRVFRENKCFSLYQSKYPAGIGRYRMRLLGA